ncbi:MAG: acyl-CoA dehydrogenase family protein [Acidimicrobiia bacterium]
MRFSLSDDLIALTSEAERFALEAVARFGSAPDSWIAGFSRECSRALAARGWIGMTWPTEMGGGGRPRLERALISEVLITHGVPIGGSWFADRQMGPTLIAFGSREQQHRFLPGMLAGETTWCIGMSEPEAGSDLASLRTRAVRDGDEWVITGHKIWTSFAALADYCYLICRTSASTLPHEGISEIVVPLDGRQGIDIRPIRDATGASHFCEVFFDEVRVPLDNLVGTEGGSWRQTMRQLEHERGGIDRLASNRRVFLAACQHLNDNPSLKTPQLRDEHARLEVEYRLGRLLVLRETLQQAPRQFSAATKTFCTEYEQRVASFAASAIGMQSTLECEVARGVMYSPAYTIMGGTSNVLRNIIAERVLGLPR